MDNNRDFSSLHQGSLGMLPSSKNYPYIFVDLEMTAKQLPFLDRKVSTRTRKCKTTSPLPTSIPAIPHSSFPTNTVKETPDALPFSSHPSLMVPNGRCQQVGTGERSLETDWLRILYPKSCPTSLTTKFSHKLMIRFSRSSSIISMMCSFPYR